MGHSHNAGALKILFAITSRPHVQGIYERNISEFCGFGLDSIPRTSHHVNADIPKSWTMQDPKLFWSQRFRSDSQPVVVFDENFHHCLDFHPRRCGDDHPSPSREHCLRPPCGDLAAEIWPQFCSMVQASCCAPLGPFPLQDSSSLSLVAMK